MKIFHGRAKVPVPNNGWEGRFADRFALAYAAGRLAIEWGILPWSRQELLDAVVTVYHASRSVVPKQTSIANIIARIFTGLRDTSRILDLRSTAQHTAGPSVDEADGFIKKNQRGVYYVIKPAALERWVGKNVDLAVLVEKLLDDGHLITEKGRDDIPTKQVKIRGISGRPRYYCIRENRILAARS
jgi:hypothetical protein